MSWIVQSLLSNQERIRTKSHPTIKYEADTVVFNTYNNRDLIYSVDSEDAPDEHVTDSEPCYDDPFIEGDEFNDLLIVERAIEELQELRLLSEDDLQVLKRERGNYNRENGQRKTHSKHYSSVCERIAYYLGGYFTDEGYIHYLADKYGLTGEQVGLLRVYIKSNLKNKILRKEFKLKDNHEKDKYVSA